MVLVRLSFKELPPKTFRLLCGALVRPHLKYCVQVCSSHLVWDVDHAAGHLSKSCYHKHVAFFNFMPARLIPNGSTHSQFQRKTRKTWSLFPTDVSTETCQMRHQTFSTLLCVMDFEGFRLNSCRRGQIVPFIVCKKSASIERIQKYSFGDWTSTITS